MSRDGGGQLGGSDGRDALADLEGTAAEQRAQLDSARVAGRATSAWLITQLEQALRDLEILEAIAAVERERREDF